GIAAPKSFPQGTPLFVENMISDSMLVIGDGRVGLSTRSPAGADVQLGELGKGDWLGEISLISTGQRMCTATALTAVRALE
ncbi:cyclic nucleotide-binding domain-containing protein, partial [Escherichia coli]|uniref:cyclic nucleotide-binding domain-containing protein n=1 Tax=Escherichia coli TaxID=562 RepID=UPI0021DFE4BF